MPPRTSGCIRRSPTPPCARLSLVNIARSGIFAADRAVREYAERIWEVHA
ncbi:MAG: glycogen/starch/alpha-glucan phosphorylase [Oscillospiraceae bacterium]